MRIVCFLLAAAAAVFAADLSIEAERKINLLTQQVRHETRLKIKNTGKEEVTTYDVAFEVPLYGTTAWMRVVNNKRALRLTPHEDRANVFTVKLTEPLVPGATTTMLVKQVITHGQIPRPSVIGQRDDQYMTYEHNVYVPSAYKVAKQTTKVTVPDGFKEVRDVVKPQATAKSEVTYGPLNDIAAFEEKMAMEHYKSNSPFLTVYDMSREVTVSHWGRSKVEEIIKLRHDGAKLKGFFSRVDWMRSAHLPNNGAPAAITKWTTELPAQARDVEYRDDVGNISTSNLRSQLHKQQLELRPRFPIFGGWNTDYMLNYTVPTNLYLSREGDQYTLKLPFLSHVFANVVVDDFEMRVVLPEGAENIQFKVKFGVDEEARDVKATYLDTAGRPVLIVRKHNLVDEHMVDCEVTYTFTQTTLFNEPLLLIAAYMTVFFLAIVWQRSDFSIAADEIAAEKKRK